MNTSAASAERTPMSRTRVGPDTERLRLLRRASEELHQRGPRRREALGHLRGHRRVVRGRLPLEQTHPRPDPSGGEDEHRQEHDGEQRDHPREPEHDAEGEHEDDDVGDHARQRRRERPLGADHVVVETADERAGVRPGEEGDRHRLHVVEDLPPQVEDQALAEPRRHQPLDEADDGVDDGDDGQEQRHGDDDAAGARAFDDGVDGPPGQQRRGDAEHGGHDRQAEEGGDRAPVRPGELADAAQGRAVEAAPPRLAVVLHGAVEGHPGVDLAHAGRLRVQVRLKSRTMRHEATRRVRGQDPETSTGSGPWVRECLVRLTNLYAASVPLTRLHTRHRHRGDRSGRDRRPAAAQRHPPGPPAPPGGGHRPHPEPAVGPGRRAPPRARSPWASWPTTSGSPPRRSPRSSPSSRPTASSSARSTPPTAASAGSAPRRPADRLIAEDPPAQDRLAHHPDPRSSTPRSRPAWPPPSTCSTACYADDEPT